MKERNCNYLVYKHHHACHAEYREAAVDAGLNWPNHRILGKKHTNANDVSEETTLCTAPHHHHLLRPLQ
jgi:hypothetical protein